MCLTELHNHKYAALLNAAIDFTEFSHLQFNF